MDRRNFLRTSTVTAGTLLVAGCSVLDAGGSTSTPPPTPGAATETPPAGNRISMNGSNAAGQFYFGPIGLHIQSGETVRWEAASGQHSTKAFHPTYDEPLRIPEDAEPWYSGALSYSSFEHTFEVEGTYDYFCSIHYNHAMVGRVVVGDPGGPAEGAETPYGRVPSAEAIVEAGEISYGEFSD